MTSVANAEWTEVSKNVNLDTYYVDLERIKKHSGKVYYWELGDYLKPTETGTMSNKAYVEAECGRFRYRFLSQTYYKGPMASGKINVSSNTPEKDWYYPPPNSSSEDILKAACNHKP
jgi:hypothetical protein